MAGTFELKRGESGKYMFNLKAGNGQVILTSQAYQSKSSALTGIESVRRHGPDPACYQREVSTAGEPYFLLVASNGQTIGKSQMYAGEEALDKGMVSVQANAADARLVDHTGK
jgi:uncharacterized protein